jgi:hypothetical protein
VVLTSQIRHEFGIGIDNGFGYWELIAFVLLLEVLDKQFFCVYLVYNLTEFHIVVLCYIYFQCKSNVRLSGICRLCWNYKT